MPRKHHHSQHSFDVVSRGLGRMPPNNTRPRLRRCALHTRKRAGKRSAVPCDRHVEAVANA
eukprot:3106103-Pyramimonas_sp.AAC.1